MTQHPVAQDRTNELLISSDQRLPSAPLSSQSGRRTALVKAVSIVCSGVVSIELCSAVAAEPFPPFEAGAHIDLHLQGDMVRSYSLHNAPG